MIRDKCAKCGAELQMTHVHETDFSLEGGVWVRKDSEQMEARIYCANDHRVINIKELDALVNLPIRQPE